MSKALKWTLLILGVLVLLCLAGVGGFAWWLNANKETLKADGDKAKQEGEAFGRATDANGCVTEGLRRLSARSGIMAKALNNLFLEHCLDVAERPSQFCDGVPPNGQIIQSAAWAVQACQERGQGGNQDCGNMMQVVQKACSKPKQPAPPAQTP
jgi:hypothetical protein